MSAVTAFVPWAGRSGLTFGLGDIDYCTVFGCPHRARWFLIGDSWYRCYCDDHTYYVNTTRTIDNAQSVLIEAVFPD